MKQIFKYKFNHPNFSENLITFQKGSVKFKSYLFKLWIKSDWFDLGSALHQTNWCM